MKPRYTTLTELFSDRSRWTQQAYARDDAREPIAADNLCAASWCLLGGFKYCYGHLLTSCYSSSSSRAYSQMLGRLEAEVDRRGFCSPMFYNDHVTYEEIVDLVTSLEL